MAKYIFCCIFMFLLQSVVGYRILGIFIHSGKSHFDVFQPLLFRLAEKGHEVTVVSHFPLSKPVKNYRDISLRGTMPIWHTIFAFDDFTFYTPTERFMRHYLTGNLLAGFGNMACRALMQNEQVHQLQRGQFDVALVEMFNSDCGLGLVYNLDVPYIGLTSHVMMAYTFPRLGLIENPSIVATHHLEHGDRPNLWQTTESFIVTNMYKWIYYHASQKVDQEILSGYIKDLPPLESIARNTSLILVNTHHALNGVNLYPPNTIEIGGIHLTNKTSTMDPQMEKFLDDCEEGVIVFSMGSMIKAVSWPEEKLKAFKMAFAEIPQIVVWKWENETMEGITKNVKIFKWLPQFDTLKHKNVRGFISHAGNLGLTEAVYAGVPILSIPMYGDQFNNAASAKHRGIGVVVDFKNVTIDSIRWGLKEILSPKLQTRAKQVSKIWKDRPSSAIDTATYWVEHIAQYGGEHLRPPTLYVPWYRYILLDVLTLILSTATVFLYIFFKITVYVYSIAFKKSANKHKAQ